MTSRQKDTKPEFLIRLIHEGKEIPRIPPAILEKPVDLFAALQAEAPGKAISFVQRTESVFFCPWPGDDLELDDRLRSTYDAGSHGR